MPDGRITYDLFWLLQSDYPADTFAVYVCRYFKCTPFVASLVATLFTREGPKTVVFGAKNIDILHHLLQMDFAFFKPDSLGDFF